MFKKFIKIMCLLLCLLPNTKANTLPEESISFNSHISVSDDKYWAGHFKFENGRTITRYPWCIKIRSGGSTSTIYGSMNSYYENLYINMWMKKDEFVEALKKSDPNFIEDIHFTYSKNEKYIDILQTILTFGIPLSIVFYQIFIKEKPKIIFPIY